MQRQNKEECDRYQSTSLSLVSISQDVAETLFYQKGKVPQAASARDFYEALALTVRKHMLHRWVSTVMALAAEKARVVCYFSAEYLLGPHLGKNLLNLGIYDVIQEALAAKGRSLDRLLEQEVEPGLGNGGLGRLAACYLDSLASLEVPAVGYGLRYEFGIFQQEIQDGWQVERTD